MREDLAGNSVSAKTYTYAYPRGALSVDCVVFGCDRHGLKILLIERGLPPFEGSFALPGGFVQMDESPHQAALRELQEETGLAGVELTQLHTFGAVHRDPRERVVSIAHVGFVDPSAHTVRGATDARQAAWFHVDDVPPLAFDHEEILMMGRERLKNRRLHAFSDLRELLTTTQRPSRWG